MAHPWLLKNGKNRERGLYNIKTHVTSYKDNIKINYKNNIVTLDILL